MSSKTELECTICHSIEVTHRVQYSEEMGFGEVFTAYLCAPHVYIFSDMWEYDVTELPKQEAA